MLFVVRRTIFQKEKNLILKKKVFVKRKAAGIMIDSNPIVKRISGVFAEYIFKKHTLEWFKHTQKKIRIFFFFSLKNGNGFSKKRFLFKIY
jgi:hypothetical protein